MASRRGRKRTKRGERRHVMLRAIEDLAKEFASGSERGLVILGAAIIEGALTELLDVATESLPSLPRNICVEVQNLSFGRKIQLCYLLRGISNSELGAIQLVNKMRNEFAHKVVSLKDSSMKAKLRKLEETLGVVKGKDFRRVFELFGEPNLGEALTGTVNKAGPVVFYLSVSMLTLLVYQRAVEMEGRYGLPPPENVAEIEKLRRAFQPDEASMEDKSAKPSPKG